MDFLQNLCKKILSVVAHTALTITGALTMLLSLGGFLSGELIGGGIVLLLGFAMTAVGTRSLWYPGYKEKQAEKEQLQNIKNTSLESGTAQPVTDFAQDSYQKAVSDFNALNGIIRQLQDQDLADQLKKMQGIALRMINYMKEHPDKISIADQFINYYQDRALSLSEQFLEFEQMGLGTPEVNAIKIKTKRTLESFDEAYEAQFSRMLTDKMLEVESELKVAEQIMSDAGIQNTSEMPKSHRTLETSTATTAYRTPDATSRQAPSAPPPAMKLPDITLENNPFSIDRPFDIGETSDASPCRSRQKKRRRPRGRFQK